MGQNFSTTLWDTDSQAENNYFKLLLLKVVRQAVESWSVLSFPQDDIRGPEDDFINKQDSGGSSWHVYIN